MAEIDELESARRHFERVSAGDFADVPRDEAWLITLAIASEACAQLGEYRRARELLAQAHSTARELGLKRLLEQVRQVEA